MTQKLTIVMYHYVRDADRSPYPGIKARSLAEFRGQLDYIQRFYNVISGNDLLAAATASAHRLPPNPLLLTFDDGYRDHFTNVLPILADRGLAAVFAPVVRSVTERNILDVNKIHHVLSAAADRVGELIAGIFASIDAARGEFDLQPNDAYWQEIAHPNRFDPAEIIFVKRMLQRDLPESLRARITDALFRRYVTADPLGFADELYMSRDELRQMVQAGMTIASHGYDHYWLATLPAEQQRREIQRSLAFLAELGQATNRWIFSYPYGSHNDSLLTIARELGCCVGLTTVVGLATAGDDPLLLPRLDTNDLPTTDSPTPTEWTQKALRLSAHR